ncbi:hypothetical protein HPP92_013798 [Vanilla planifolia]|uniref:1-phosphatidylinositol 4-kinase n=1 Tax=Vanilla planifolia TaxID=51239 RepID=A0A835UX25_VANPL|nr:hypothetical protein HPP92_013798 [Vanilla planifolia]
MDRHAGNILVANDDSKLVPIDHGLCLPEILDDPYFEWLHWPQAAVPFSDLEAEYVAKLDAFHDAELLRSELPSLRESAIRLLILCTVFLQRAVLAGLCLADIGDMMTRNFGRLDDGVSVLEALCKKAGEAVAELESDGSYSGDELKECQFVMDCKGEATEEVLDIPLLLRSKKKRALDPLQEEDEGEGREDVEELNLEKGGGMMMKKSASFSAGELNHEGISFKGMSEEQWRLFLEKFEQVLPEAFEARKIVGLSQRLGSSCSF